jgi:predicted nucleotidyltransferase
MTTFDLSTLDALPEHQRLLQRAWKHLETDPRVAGLAVSGSIASGNADSYSDIDLDVIAHDEDFDALFADRDGAAEAIGQPLFRFIADHLPFGSFMYIVLYDGPVKVDFSYQRASQIGPRWTLAKRLVLKDVDGFLTHVISQSQGLAPDQLVSDRIGMSWARSCGGSCGKR